VIYAQYSLCCSLLKVLMINFQYFSLNVDSLQTESNGTVLSTNWKDIGTGKVDMKAPSGQEFKKWD
jgi:SGS domain